MQVTDKEEPGASAVHSSPHAPTQIFMGEVARLALQDASSAAANSLVTLACFKSCTNSLARCLG